MGFERDEAIDLDDLATGAEMPPVHPGVVLREEFLEPLGLTAYRLAKALDVPKNRVTGIVNGARSVTGDTALRLARFFGTSPEFWVNLQAHYDLEVARRERGAESAASMIPRQQAAA